LATHTRLGCGSLSERRPASPPPAGGHRCRCVRASVRPTAAPIAISSRNCDDARAKNHSTREPCPILTRKRSTSEQLPSPLRRSESSGEMTWRPYDLSPPIRGGRCLPSAGSFSLAKTELTTFRTPGSRSEDSVAPRRRISSITPRSGRSADKIDRQILDSLADGDGHSARAIAALIGLSPRAARTRLARLVAVGKVREIGTDLRIPSGRIICRQRPKGGLSGEAREASRRGRSGRLTRADGSRPRPRSPRARGTSASSPPFLNAWSHRSSVGTE
jgi:hypothetical protein